MENTVPTLRIQNKTDVDGDGHFTRSFDWSFAPPATGYLIQEVVSDGQRWYEAWLVVDGVVCDADGNAANTPHAAWEAWWPTDGTRKNWSIVVDCYWADATFKPENKAFTKTGPDVPGGYRWLGNTRPDEYMTNPILTESLQGACGHAPAGSGGPVWDYTDDDIVHLLATLAQHRNHFDDDWLDMLDKIVTFLKRVDSFYCAARETAGIDADNATRQARAISAKYFGSWNKYLGYLHEIRDVLMKKQYPRELVDVVDGIEDFLNVSFTYYSTSGERSQGQ